MKRCPGPMEPGQEGEIEIRQVFELSDFPPEDAAREQALREELRRKPAKP